MNSSERRMKLILMLQQSNHRITVNDIAEKFDVSRRTVFRDFNALSEMNVPVTWDEYNGYGIMHGYKIPPLMFTTKELATILVGLNFVKSQVDQTLISDAKGVELKIKEVLPDELLQFMESLGKRTVVDPYMNFGAEKKEGGNWYLISNAIADNKKISFDYRSKSDNNISSRKIDPYLIVFYKDHWNVIGHSHKREAVRNFVLDRMSKVEVLSEEFVPYGQIDVEGLIFRSDGSSRKIVIDVHKNSVSRFKANLPTKIIKNIQKNPNLFRITFEFNNLDYINKWLLQFHNNVKVVDPKVLIEKRNKILNKMIDNT
ncbi:Predicted DNA-binding transcriptional regulator YafY, contains an HTH and WYL domains [Fodinibius roseus]|uniref:Predicted DNA-binding transcriptional regulator YafY, contains an HTH and WYL domains n=1 Tax=Fodinibius roseus TaxID=1194090 RepID=A0A1M5JRP8_9BACT|nr:YafY family protein [Fodinibius roseus]SHG43231.1 Predicted DNA-binding transcriptional regulator YafY, contains an HTH and WYL domains [Fodinibius roseus]